MGAYYRSNCTVYSDKTAVSAPNPNPINFRIVSVEEYGKALVATIDYPDCTNYEGRKLCVFLHVCKEELMQIESLDPHFSKSRLSPVARFAPDRRGRYLARHTAEALGILTQE